MQEVETGMDSRLLCRVGSCDYAHVSLSACPGWKSRTAVGRAERSSLKQLLQTQVIEE